MIVTVMMITITVMMIMNSMQGVHFGSEQLNVPAIFEEVEEEVLVAVSDLLLLLFIHLKIFFIVAKIVKINLLHTIKIAIAAVSS